MLTQNELYNTTLEERKAWNKDKINMWFKQRRENRMKMLDNITAEYANDRKLAREGFNL